MFEPGEYSLSDFDKSKKLIHLLRHGIQVHREDDGAVQFWKIKDNSSDLFLVLSSLVLTTCGRKAMAGRGGNKKRYHYCTDSSGIILYFRALQGHSGRSLIDRTLQDNVIIPDCFFKYILSCRMCNQFTFHHQFGIDTGRSKFEQQIDSILSACGSHGQKS